jgi:hypothetical protein
MWWRSKRLSSVAATVLLGHLADQAKRLERSLWLSPAKNRSRHPRRSTYGDVSSRTASSGRFVDAQSGCSGSGPTGQSPLPKEGRLFRHRITPLPRHSIAPLSTAPSFRLTVGRSPFTVRATRHSGSNLSGF